MSTIPATGHLSATTAAAVNTPMVMTDRIRSKRPITCQTSSWAGRSTASQ